MVDYKAPQIGDPLWLAHAFGDLRLHELAGKRHEPRILEMYRKAGHPEIDNDETAWCAAAVGAWLHDGGCKNTGSLMARSYEKYGRRLDKSKTLPRGAICVWPRGNPPSGHVNLLLHDDGEYLTCIGGNQGDMVSIARFSRTDLVCAVWPTEAPMHVPVKPVQPKFDTEDELPVKDEKPCSWWKKGINWIKGGGAATAISGVAGSVYDYRVAIVFSCLVVALVILFGVYWKWFRK